MTKAKKIIWLFVGVLAFLVLYLVPIEGLSREGQAYLSLTVMTLIFWCTQVIYSSFAGGLYLAMLVLLNVAPADTVFNCWSTATIWLVVGAYLFCVAINRSGLGERISIYLIKHHIKSYRSAILTIMVLSIILAAFIPHPWPRMFLLISVVRRIIKDNCVPTDVGRWLIFAVCAFSTSTGLVFLTSDNVLSGIALNYSGETLSWLKWLAVMSVPTLVLCSLEAFAFIVVFKPKTEVCFDAGLVQCPDRVSRDEKTTLVWVVVAVVSWGTDFIHGIPLGWVTLLIAMLMSMPGIGVLKTEDWKSVPMSVLVLVTATMALATLGERTGVNAWIVDNALPADLPQLILPAILVVVLCTLCSHMFMGSAIPVMCVMTPAMISYGASVGIGGLPIAMLCYIVSATHFALPFHHLNLAIGAGEADSFSSTETLRFAPALTLVLLVAVFGAYIPWWALLKVL